MSLEQLEGECLKAFKQGHKQNAERLLPQIKQPADIRTKIHNIPHLEDAGTVSLLHLAASNGWVDVIINLITNYKCHLDCKDSHGRTPLHYATSNNHLEVIRYFINEQHCDPMTKDYEGETPLHLACNIGYTNIVQYLLSTGKVDPLAKNKDGKTPMYLASTQSNSYHLLKLFQSFPQCKRDFPVHTYTKLILTGYSGAGKTTISQLILLLATKPAGFFSSGRVTDVEIEYHTAGIIPLHVESKVKEVGNMVIYDFAGQQEYYSSHAVERIMRNSAAIFACIVDLSQCMEKISTSIHYWFSFIENACSSAQGSSHVIIVGSHADLIKSIRELKEKSLLVNSIAESRVKQLAYGGFVSMDCRLSKTKEAHHFRSLLSVSQQAILSSQPSISLYCHVLYRFLRTKLGKTSCTLQELTSALASEEDFTPESTLLTESLTTLSDKGLILFMQDQEHPQSSWVVVEKKALLRVVNGTLFAPSNFKQYCQVASNTGIVPIATLEELFPQYSLEMLVGCLESMELCLPVDLSVFQGTNLESNKATPSEVSNLFFPSLVKHYRPVDLPSPRFGWCLGCSDPHQYFSNRFLHILLLRLAFTFPLASRHLPPSSSLYGLERICKMWQNGICWKSVSGVFTIVEIIDRNRWVIFMVSEKTREAVETCSSVIRMILDLQQQLCSVVSTCECLISPSLLDLYPFDALPDTDLFDLPTVARSMLLRHKILLDRKEACNKLSTDKALSCEPYYLLQSSSVCQLFKQSIASQPVPDSLLQEVLKFCRLPQQKPRDHKELREYVNKHSIFAGRNPLEVAELKEEDISYMSKHSGILTDLYFRSLKLERLMKTKGSIHMSVIQCMPFGPPRIGKTCIKDRLAGKKPKGEPARMEGNKIVYPAQVSMSTGAADDVMKLFVESSSATTFQEQDEKWVQYDFNQEVISLVKGLDNLVSKPTMFQAADPLSQRVALQKLTTIAKPRAKLMKPAVLEEVTLPIAQHDSQQYDVAMPDVEAQDVDIETTVEVNINPIQPVNDAFHHVDSSKVKALLENSLTIHFTDTGGQPEFQEIIPMLVAGPSLFLLVFSLALSLDHCYEVKYDAVDEELEPYISAFTVKNVLLQCLASIACIGTQRKEKEGGMINIKPKVLFIGTQLDLLTDSSQLNQISSELWEAIGRQGLQHLVERNLRNQCIFAVNNYDKSDASFNAIRKVVSDVAKREEEMYMVNLPVPFVLLDFYLRQPKERRLQEETCRGVLRKYDLNIEELEKFLKKEMTKRTVDIYDPRLLAEASRVLSQVSDEQIPPKTELLIQALMELNELSHCRDHVMTMEQFKTIAEKCGITSNDELKEALWTLHHLLGTIRHYPEVAELKDTVITHQQLFFNIPTKLITSTFSLKKRRRKVPNETCDKFYEQGFFTMDDLNKLWEQEKTHLTSKQLVALLQHLHILGPFVDEDGTNGYFLPCVLKHAPEQSSIGPAHKPIAEPLLVSFDCGFTPNGMFSGLLVFLLEHCSEDGLEIKLFKQHLFRNQASLYVKPFIYLTIKAMPEYIRFSLHQHKAVNSSGICATVKAVISKGLDLVTSRLNYNINASLKFGFECTCDSKPTHFTEYKPPCTPICSSTGCHCDAPSNYTQWFDEVTIEDTTPPQHPAVPDTKDVEMKTDCLTSAAGVSLAHSNMQAIVGAPPPTLMKLESMKGADGKPLEIVQTIAAHDYKTFGMYLLQDKNQKEVDLIEKDHNSKGAKSVTIEILKKWLRSDAPTRTYQHLIECLRQSELGALADELIANATVGQWYATDIQYYPS